MFSHDYNVLCAASGAYTAAAGGSEGLHDALVVEVLMSTVGDANESRLKSRDIHCLAACSHSGAYRIIDRCCADQR